MNDAGERMVQHNNKLYQKDDFVRALYNAAGLTVEGVLERLDEAEKQEFFDTMTETGVKLIEGYLGIIPPKDADIAERRQNVQSNWLAAKGKKFTIEMIQDVAEAWDNGAVAVQFIGGKIIISFTQIFGVPKYIESITATIEKIKPAHIGFEFVYRTHSWRDLKAYTWEWAQAKTWAEIKEGNWGEVYRKL